MSTNNDYNREIDADDVAGQIQRVADRRHQGNKLRVAPVTYWRGHYTGELVYLVSNTYPPVAAVIVSLDTWQLGPFDKATRKGFTVEVTEYRNPFFRIGEQIDRVSPNQLLNRKLDRLPRDTVVIERIDAAKITEVS